MRQNLGTALTVTATEKWLAAVQAGQAFAQFANVLGVAAQFAHIQLFNPVGSGKIVLARALMFGVGAAASFGLTVDNVNRATDVGPGTNLLNGGAASVAHVRTESNAAIQGVQFGVIAALALQTITPPIEWFMQLAPGQGLDVVGTVVNNQLFGTFFWTET